MAQKREMYRTVEINWAQSIYSHRRRCLPGQRTHTEHTASRYYCDQGVSKDSRHSIHSNGTAVSPFCLVPTAGSHSALS